MRQLGDRTRDRDPRVEVTAEPQVNPGAGGPLPRNSHRGSDAEIVGEVENVEVAAASGQGLGYAVEKRIAEAGEIDASQHQPVVPPDRAGIPLDQLHQCLQDRLLERVAGGAAV